MNDPLKPLEKDITNLIVSKDNTHEILKEKDEYVALPNGEITVSMVGEIIGKRLAVTKKYFNRGSGLVVEIKKGTFNEPIVSIITSARLVSVMDEVAKFANFSFDKESGEVITKAKVCSEQIAKLLLNSSRFQDELPKLNLLSKCPVLVADNGKCREILGYDSRTGIYAFGEPTKEVSVDEAKELLFEAISDFNFVSDGDKARALANMISPALIFGKILKGRAPIDLGEANHSQAGKGFRNKITAAIYNSKVRTITQKKGGVGSLEESLSTSIIRGDGFISFDNLRGKLDSANLESFMTEDEYLARSPHKTAIPLDPTRTTIQITSNKVETTEDLMNRAACVRINKQLEGYIYKKYPEGNILSHVRANQPKYLGAVNTIVKEWVKLGKPKTDETRHDFREWVQNLDWICQNILGTVPIMDGHKEAKKRMTNTFLSWLREVSIYLIEICENDKWMSTSTIIDYISESDIEIPGLNVQDLTDENVRKKILQATGRKFMACFKSSKTIELDSGEPIDEITFDNIKIQRRVTYNIDIRKDIKEYLFKREELIAPIDESCAYSATIAENSIGADASECYDSMLELDMNEYATIATNTS